MCVCAESETAGRQRTGSRREPVSGSGKREAVSEQQQQSAAAAAGSVSGQRGSLSSARERRRDWAISAAMTQQRDVSTPGIGATWGRTGPGRAGLGWDEPSRAGLGWVEPGA